MTVHRSAVLGGATLTLLVGVTAGLVVGGSGGLPWGSHPDAASAATETSSTPVPRTPSEQPLKEGAVEVDQAAEDASSVGRGAIRTLDGAATAFSTYAVWVVGSPAALEDPALVAETIGGTVINSADAQLLAGMQRSAGDTFAAEDGAYRVIGHSGSAERPDQVMVEVAAPLSVKGKTRWAVVGGVVQWTSEGWTVASIQPREVPQPSDADQATDLSSEERAKTLAGLGWRLFADER
ncbi:hypothetical protein ASD11_02715 [Aeromicrobium sp. Root495]|uniref:hypothetical protein n=1 Tax=Aeromicrobium sp. Root495 TaxID=1736550 RepID=UPI0006FADB5E|nr:hypothetical protein [Aeromicrobium sp. Root495]KQY58587.1 hypothetical protein ASD11_02715 [Aeromicrobium sp. Root495]